MKSLIFILMFGGVGVAMIVFGFGSLVKTRRFVATAIRTAGKVVAYRSEESIFEDDDGRSVKQTFYYPIVEFKDAQGAERRAETSLGSSPPSYPVQTAVTLLYNAADPAKVEIEAFGQLWLAPILFLSGGAIFLSIAIGVWIFNVPVQ